MSTSAFVIGELSWPMTDHGLVAVWRAMPIDRSRWNDWGELDVGEHAGTVGALVDEMHDVPCTLEVHENGAHVRGRIDDPDAWQRLVIAWRAAADLGANGELVWCEEPRSVAYKATVSGYSSQWARLSSRERAALGFDDGAPKAPKKSARKAAKTAPKPATRKTRKTTRKARAKKRR